MQKINSPFSTVARYAELFNNKQVRFVAQLFPNAFIRLPDTERMISPKHRLQQKRKPPDHFLICSYTPVPRNFRSFRYFSEKPGPFTLQVTPGNEVDPLWLINDSHLVLNG